jgi:hypothetical protein
MDKFTAFRLHMGAVCTSEHQHMSCRSIVGYGSNMWLIHLIGNGRRQATIAKDTEASHV